MPLSKARNAKRMRLVRLHVQPEVVSIGGGIPEGMTLPRSETTVSHTDNVVQPTEGIPLYNPSKHKAGDKVRMNTGQVVVIPELDGDGRPIPW